MAKYFAKPFPEFEGGVRWNLSSRKAQTARAELARREELWRSFAGQLSPVVGLMEDDKMIDTFDTATRRWKGENDG